MLKRAGIGHAASIIIGGVESRGAKEADALTLSIILLLQVISYDLKPLTS